MKPKHISIINARENNLKNVTIDIPKDKLIVITGVSGSGKSTLAFDVLYSEGRRRYVDSLSTYARQFLGGTNKPDVEAIEGLSPAIAIDQKTTSNNPRSTVGTTTEVYDFYRLLFARIGKPYCPKHNIEISSQTVTSIIEKVFKDFKNDSRLQILSPIVTSKKGSHKDLITRLKKEGFIRLKINDDIYKISDEFEINQKKRNTISIVIDRIILNKDNRSRLFEAIQIASDYANGLVIIENLDEEKEELFSRNFACKHCDFQMSTIEPRLFSFNSPAGACSKCNGLGTLMQVTWERLINEELSILEGGLNYFKLKQSGIEWSKMAALLKHYKIDITKQLSEFTNEEKKIILHGSSDPIQFKLKIKNNYLDQFDYIEGLGDAIERRYVETSSIGAREYYYRFMDNTVCDLCHGERLNEQALAVRINNISISDLTKISIENSYKWITSMELDKQERDISKLIVNEILSRLKFLINVGLGYLTLNRLSRSLSGGESQRIRLASQLGSKLTGVLYVLDEPSIGLHQKDNLKLINTLKEIRDLGNTVIVVEHDEETMREADYIIDIGPKAGDYGGEIVAKGSIKEILKYNCLTSKFLSGKDVISIPEKRRPGSNKFITIKGAQENNLKNISVEIPLNKFVVVSGVSGSGKSTLVNEILYKSIHKILSSAEHLDKPGKHKSIEGLVNIDKVVRISQDPIGKTPRSNPATYTSVFDDIRDLFAKTKEAQLRGYLKGRFSFNVNGGRCEKCRGDGTIKISMHFLPDVYIKCSECRGKRYNEETLQIKYKNKNVSDILNMSVEAAYDFFKNIPRIKYKLEFLRDVGLGYIILGHNAVTLSGGEAQRVKLATHLQKRPTGKTLYILDEPTTGLHNYDIKILLKVLNRIVDSGDSIIVIEHNLDVIKVADHIIDMGIEGGDKGGEIIVQGPPELVARNSNSETGKYLKKILNK